MTHRAVLSAFILACQEMTHRFVLSAFILACQEVKGNMVLAASLFNSPNNLLAFTNWVHWSPEKFSCRTPYQTNSSNLGKQNLRLRQCYEKLFRLNWNHSTNTGQGKAFIWTMPWLTFKIRQTFDKELSFLDICTDSSHSTSAFFIHLTITVSDTSPL